MCGTGREGLAQASRGANRLGTNSLLDLLVFGKSAGDFALANGTPSLSRKITANISGKSGGNALVGTTNGVDDLHVAFVDKKPDCFHSLQGKPRTPSNLSHITQLG